jgi:colicin import membrane protein
MSLNGEEIEDNMIITNTSSLSSIQEDTQFDPQDDDIGITGADALAWLDDENSVASFSSSASTKSRAQRRLESYKRTTPSKADFDAKLEAAERRREKSLFATKENAGFSAKMDKVSKQMQAAESKIAELSQKFNYKMKAASERKSQHLEGFVRGKVVNKNIKLEKAKDRRLAKDTKVSALEKKLEAKLLAALERKEAIIAAKAAKAADDISASANRGQNAGEKKEQMMLKIKDKSQKKMNSASKRRKQLRALEKKKKEVMIIRREMAKSMSNDDKIESIQKKLAVKMSSAQERKQLYVDAKAAKASTYASSVSERGQEITRKRESSGGITKSTLDEKLEAATKRKAELQAKFEEKNAKAKARRERAREIAKQRKAERGEIANWEDESVSASVVDNIIENMKSEDLEDIDLSARGNASREQKESSSDNSYEEKRLKAKQLLMDEIQLANEVKQHEMVLVTKEMKKSRKPASIRRDISDSGASVQSFGTLDTNEVLSFDGGEVSISGLSTVREEQLSADRRKAQTALALAELDIKLSEIQIMQAILLAEEASLSGKDEFKTADASVEDLESVKGTDKFLRQKRMDERKDMVQNRAKQFFASTMKQAKIAKVRAGNTLFQVRNNIEKHEKRKRRNRPSTAPTFVSRPSTAPSPIV